MRDKKIQTWFWSSTWISVSGMSKLPIITHSQCSHLRQTHPTLLAHSHCL